MILVGRDIPNKAHQFACNSRDNGVMVFTLFASGFGSGDKGAVELPNRAPARRLTLLVSCIVDVWSTVVENGKSKRFR